MDEQGLTQQQKADIKASLERIIADPKFKASERNRRFLTFIVENTLNGQSDRIKGYSIAVDVFGRSETFDSAVDPIVRIEAGRLRTSLAQYYERNGAHEPIRIEIPKGAYRPNFLFDGPAGRPKPPVAPTATRRPPPVAVPEGVPHASDGLAVRARRLFNRLASRTRLTVVGVLLGAGLLSLPTVTSWSAHATRGSEPPVLLIAPVTALDDTRETGMHARTLAKALIVALGQFPGIVLAEQGTRDVIEAARAHADARRQGSVYVVRLSIRRDDRLHTYWTLSNGRTGEAVWSEQASTALDPVSGVTVEDVVARRLAAMVAGGGGLIRTLERRLLPEPVPAGHACVLYSMGRVFAADARVHAAAQDCLSRTVQIEPRNADAWALLAQVSAATLVNGFASRADADGATREARAALRRAGELAPHASHTLSASLVLAMIDGDEAAALRLAERVIEAAPADPDARSLVAQVLFRLGHYDRARETVGQSVVLLTGAIMRDRSVLLLDAFREGRLLDAMGELADAPPDVPLTRLLQAAVYGRMGDPNRARDALTALRGTRAEVQADAADRLRLMGFRGPFVEQVSAGLRLAGLSKP